MTIGACATAGGIQALRNFADVDEFCPIVYARPEYIETLATSTPIAAHVAGRLRAARLPDRQGASCSRSSAPSCSAGAPRISADSVCVECKRRGNVCVMVAHGTPCLGPVTHAGCGALCPSLRPRLLRLLRARGDARTRRRSADWLQRLGMPERDVDRVFRTFNAARPRSGGERGAMSDRADGGDDARSARRHARPRRGRGRDARAASATAR